MRNHQTIWGLPLAPLTLAETVDAATALVAAGAPSYLITANTNYAMLTARDARLRAVNARAALIVADGTPLVWASRWHATPVPERVAGSDLIFALCARAADRGFGVYLLGGAEDVNQAAAQRLGARYPGLRIVGAESPPHRPLSAEETAALVDRVRQARPDILIVAFGQPKGEFWIADHCQTLGVPLCIQLGATLDFVAGRFRRAPRALQRAGLEWAFRLALEPSRLFTRYARNAGFVAGQCTRDLARAVRGRIARATH